MQANEPACQDGTQDALLGFESMYGEEEQGAKYLRGKAIQGNAR